jgi:putative transposase
MRRWFYILTHLLSEATAARRDARVRLLKAQVDILRRKLGGNRVIPSPADRARLLSLGSELNHNVSGVIGIVTPQTYARWGIEQREGRKAGRVGRPKTSRSVRAVIQRLANENAGWGYRRIIGELKKLRLWVGRSTVRRILLESGLSPSPTRRGKACDTAWRKFLRLHMNTLVACDFFTKSVLTPIGPRLAFSLAFIHLGTRKVFLSPATYHPNDCWVKQQARNVMMWLDGQQLRAEFILHDRDTKFSSAFDRLVRSAGIQRIRTPLLAPNANAFAESWIGSFKRECLNHFLCFSLGHLDHIKREFAAFHNTHRPHQGLGNLTVPEAARGQPEAATALYAATGPPEKVAGPRTRSPSLKDADPLEPGDVRCRRFLGGLLRHYYRAA